MQGGCPVALDEEQTQPVGQDRLSVQQPVEDSLAEMGEGAGRVGSAIVDHQRSAATNVHEALPAVCDGDGRHARIGHQDDAHLALPIPGA